MGPGDKPRSRVTRRLGQYRIILTDHSLKRIRERTTGDETLVDGICSKLFGLAFDRSSQDSRFILRHGGYRWVFAKKFGPTAMLVTVHPLRRSGRKPSGRRRPRWKFRGWSE